MAASPSRIVGHHFTPNSLPEGQIGETNNMEVDAYERLPPARPTQPAHIKMESNSGSKMNITIGKIHGSCSVAEKSNVTYLYDHNGPKRPIKRRVYTTGDLTTEMIDSDSDSSDSDDSDVERFFQETAGCSKPSKNVFRDMNIPRFQPGAPGNQHIHKLVVNAGQSATAYDRDGREIPLQRTQQTRSETRTAAYSNGVLVSESRVVDGVLQPNVLSTVMNAQSAYSTKTLERTDRRLKTFEKLIRSVPKPDARVDEGIIYRVVPQFGTGWRRVFRHLDMSDTVIDLQYQECREVAETCQKLLVTWTRCSEKPTVRNLMEALVKADQFHIVEVLLQLK